VMKGGTELRLLPASSGKREEKKRGAMRRRISFAPCEKKNKRYAADSAPGRRVRRGGRLVECGAFLGGKKKGGGGGRRRLSGRKQDMSLPCCSPSCKNGREAQSGCCSFSALTRKGRRRTTSTLARDEVDALLEGQG